MELTDADPTRPSSEVIGAYFDRYERTFDLRVRRPVDVRAVREGSGGRLLVETSHGTWATRALINATGTWDRPFWPRYPGQETFRGRQLHTARYPGPRRSRGCGWSWWAAARPARSICWRSRRTRRPPPG